MADGEDLSELLERRRRPKVVEVPPGQAPVINLPPGELVTIGKQSLRFLEDGPFIIVTLERWERTLAKAIDREKLAAELVSRQVRRQMARQIRKDAEN